MYPHCTILPDAPALYILIPGYNATFLCVKTNASLLIVLSFKPFI